MIRKKRKRFDLKRALRRAVYFFPLQLLFLHFKRNHVLLVAWLILVGFLSGNLGEKFGIPNLFLFPEYLGKVGFWGFFLLGFSLGGFIMAFNIYSYIMHGHKFPFIATISRPFLKFSLNNSLFPLLFILMQVYFSVKYQAEVELESWTRILTNETGFFLGITIFIFLSFFYFFRTNKDMYKILTPSEIDRKENEARRKREFQRDTKFRKKKKWYLRKGRGTWHIETYLVNPVKVKLARGSEHYEDELLRKVFFQNHINASIFEVVMVLSFILIGSFREYPAFMIPAGATIFLLFTMLLMLASALYSWFKGWTFTVMVGLALLFNYLTLNTELFNIDNRAYGMDYSGEPALYTQDSLRVWKYNNAKLERDKDSTIKILERWKARNTDLMSDQKPKLVLMNVSGGGLRSAMWTVRSILYTDSILHGELLDHTQLITGSSGGMMGAAFVREHYYRYKTEKGHPIYHREYIRQISRDLLNPVAFSIATNDLFIRYQDFEYMGHSYNMDRGHSFEKQFNENTEHVLDKPLRAYQEPVREARIPMMIMSPSIVNDGRRLLISSQPMAYMTNNTPQTNVESKPLVENVEFTDLFRDQGAYDLRFTSALRMNATFPYILPTVSLPSEPRIEVMDAGLRDNFGIRSTLQFLYVFKDWIEENTSGVIILQLRDKERPEETKKIPKGSIISRLTRPVGSLYGNVFRIQDYNQSTMVQNASQWFEGDLDLIQLQLRHTQDDRISLSLHLTALEKQKIMNAIHLPENQRAVMKLKGMLDPERGPTSY